MKNVETHMSPPFRYEDSASLELAKGWAHWLVKQQHDWHNAFITSWRVLPEGKGRYQIQIKLGT